MAELSFGDCFEAAEMTPLDDCDGLRKIIFDLPPDLTASVAREIDFWFEALGDSDESYMSRFRQFQLVHLAIRRYGKDNIERLAQMLNGKWQSGVSRSRGISQELTRNPAA